ncbi:MAG: DUF1830 domain-containing protein [Phormidesmis sp.]
MAQIIDALPSEDDPALLCCYANVTSKIQIARITNIPNWYFERVVFPGQRLMFEAVPKAQLEIHTGMMASAILSDTISCEKLAVESSDGLDESLDSLVRKGMPPVSGASLAEARSEEGELTSAIAQ